MAGIGPLVAISRRAAIRSGSEPGRPSRSLSARYRIEGVRASSSQPTNALSPIATSHAILILAAALQIFLNVGHRLAAQLAGQFDELGGVPNRVGLAPVNAPNLGGEGQEGDLDLGQIANRALQVALRAFDQNGDHAADRKSTR